MAQTSKEYSSPYGRKRPWRRIFVLNKIFAFVFSSFYLQQKNQVLNCEGSTLILKFISQVYALKSTSIVLLVAAHSYHRIIFIAVFTALRARALHSAVVLGSLASKRGRGASPNPQHRSFTAPLFMI
jgi:hypothetical protein